MDTKRLDTRLEGLPRYIVIIPTTNIWVERYIQTSGISTRIDVHIFRLPVLSISDEGSGSDTFSLINFENILDHASLIKPDVVIWAGTSGSWLGSDFEEELLKKISVRAGAPAIGCFTSLIAELKEKELDNIGLFTPYITPIHNRIIKNISAHGFEVTDLGHLAIEDNYSFSNVTCERILSAAKSKLSTSLRLIIPMCTNMVSCVMDEYLASHLACHVLDPTVCVFERAARFIARR